MSAHNPRTDRMCLATRRSRRLVCRCRPATWCSYDRETCRVSYAVGRAFEDDGDTIRSDGRTHTHLYNRNIDRMFPCLPGERPNDVRLRSPLISWDLGGVNYEPWWWDEYIATWLSTYCATGVVQPSSMALWRYV